MLPLLVFSHLRWDFVFQRPQHLMTRLARGGEVLFFEEPVRDTAPAFIEVMEPASHVKVLRPHTPVDAQGFHDDQLPVLSGLLREVLDELSMDDYCAWLYTPLAFPLLRALEPRAVIYDCMDELSAFSEAPSQLRQREQALMQKADIVFTGGPSLYQAKRSQHPSVYCFPSAVDVAHFAQGRDSINAHPELRGLARPRLGFFGVVDERFDCDLLASMADARPDWQICIVGPVVKIDEARLPRRSNIHYFGHRTYAELPAFLAGWDVCLMPFALNEATRYISPTKTPEYMAADKPVVSTPVTDVIELYADLVIIATARDFVAACERALDQTPSETALHRAAMRQRVAGISWDRTATSMARLVEAAIEAKELVALPKLAEQAMTSSAMQPPQLNSTSAGP